MTAFVDRKSFANCHILGVNGGGITFTT